eukprot:584145_1
MVPYCVDEIGRKFDVDRQNESLTISYWFNWDITKQIQCRKITNGCSEAMLHAVCRTSFNNFQPRTMALESDRGTLVVWGKEAQKARYIYIKGKSDVETLLKAVTSASLQHLSFFDANGVRFADVHNHTLISEIGQFDADQQIWIVTIQPKNTQQEHQREDIKNDQISNAPKLVQRCHTSHNKIIYSGDNAIQWNKTTPKHNQGIAALLSLKIQPHFKSSTLKIHVNLIGRRETKIALAALFRSDDENDIYTTCNNGDVGWFVPIIMDHEMQSNVLQEIVISVRISGYALNGRKNNTTELNGTMSSSLTVEEYV